ncbi:MAG: NB-ARC domain-containing protein [Actinoplanes sp.]
MSWEVVAQEAAKTVMAGAGGVIVSGAGGVMRALLRRLGALPHDPEALRRAILRAGERDPQFAAEVTAELAAVTGASGRLPVLPPAPFFDRGEVRGVLSRPGTHLVAGLHGVGKTALVLQVCQDVAEEFPGGAAYVDLDEFRTGEALRAAEVQAAVLRQLGAPVAGDVPAELAEQYLRALVHRRFVLALDNVAGAAELRTLVQPWPASLVLVTTRRLTDDLWSWAQSPPVILHGLDEQGAREMLDERCAGAAAGEPAAVAELLALCERMPFAIQQAGALLARRRGAPGAVAAIRDELAGSGDPGELVTRCLSRAVDALDGAAVTDLLGLAAQPVEDLSHEAATAALGHRADGLIDAGLVVSENGRIRLPRLIRTFALGLRKGHQAETDAIFGRLLAFYRDTAVAADLAGGDRLRRYSIPPGLAWHRPQTPLDWLETEGPAIAAVVPRAHHSGKYVEIVQLCGALEPLLTSRGHHWLVHGVNEWGIRAARALGDRVVEARIHAVQGRILTQLHLLDRAAAALAGAERLLAGIEDPQMQSSLLEFQGSLAAAGKDYTAAVDTFRRCVAIDKQHRLARASGLHHRMLANALVLLGRPREALELLARAQALTTDVRNDARVRTVAARAHLALNDLLAAAAETAQARELAAAAGARRYEVEFADIEAEIAWRRGDVEAARGRWGWIAQFYWNSGDRRFDDYLAKLSQLPPPPR